MTQYTSHFRARRRMFQLDAPAAPAIALRSRVLAAQRNELLALFDLGRVSDSVMRRLLHELDLHAVRLE